MDPNFTRPQHQHYAAPEDGAVEALCLTWGFGAVMGSAARQWAARDPVGALTVGPCAPCPPPSAACRDVLAERNRQVSVEGWTPAHDDAHTGGELATAGACYALGANVPQAERRALTPAQMAAWHARATLWPWPLRWWKPKSERRDLVRAAALIIAEIERLDRARAGGMV